MNKIKEKIKNFVFLFSIFLVKLRKENKKECCILKGF